MTEKTAIRAAYGDALAKLGKEMPELMVFDADLSCATYSNRFAQVFPDRFFNMGIAECNMMGVAAGVATTGKIPFVHTFAMFAAGRAFEQVRNSVAYPGLNVKIVGTHAGLSVGQDGATHQCLEDIALMRVVPNMTVVNPCDAFEAEMAVRAVARAEGPCYLRIGRNPVDVVTRDNPSYRFTLGKGVTLRQGSDIAILATGIMVQQALLASETLAGQGISARVIDMHTIKPIDSELIIKAAKECGAMVTSEEHNILGGFGSAVAEVVGASYPVPVIRHGVRDAFGRSGEPDQVLDAYEVNAKGIVKAALLALELKRR